MISAIIGAIAGSIGLVTILDTITPGDLSGWFFNQIWSILGNLIEPILDLFGMLFEIMLHVAQSLLGY